MQRSRWRRHQPFAGPERSTARLRQSPVHDPPPLAMSADVVLWMSGLRTVRPSGLSATHTARHERRLCWIAASNEPRAIQESLRPRNSRVESNAEIIVVNFALAIERIAGSHAVLLGFRWSVADAPRALSQESIHATRHESHAQYLASPGG